MYHNRLIEQKVLLLAQHFKVVLLVGARQVGKSTLLQHLFPDIKHFLFDPVQDFYGVRADPDLFLNNFPAPLLLDEIQFVPELLSAIKRRVDLSSQPGQYFLTGSQNLSVLRNVSESLAGRVAIVHLGSMTSAELMNEPHGNWLNSYLLQPEKILQNSKGLLALSSNLFQMIWRGGYPGLLNKPNELLPDYFTSYVQTYLERDVRLIDNIKDLHQFDRFMSMTSTLTSQEINHAQLGREIGLSPNTAKHWLDLLSYSYQWSETWPYSGNSIKRVSKRRKGYWMDTGLACYLQRISSPDALARYPYLGALFETFIMNMISRFAESLPLAPHFYHWRTNGGAEVDLLLELNGSLYPIEIKCKTSLSKNDARGITALRATFPHVDIKPGLVIYAGNELYPITEHVFAFPWNSLLK